VKVTLIDYGAGNVASVERALQRLGAESQRAAAPESLGSAEALILPGERGLRAPLLKALRRGVPFLGICLGLQALYDSSEEAPELHGLRIFHGRIRALPASVKLPHMGWNQLRLVGKSRLLQGIAPEAHFYFAHSYAVAADTTAHSVATCTHGSEFLAVLEQDNINAVQFHPEKSGAPGAQLLSNFLRLAA
jgi:imidazole glycerol phosphate synthase glutamine amidotransferase subunit